MNNDTKTRDENIECLRKELQAHPDLLARFTDLHPPLHIPTTLEEALTQSWTPECVDKPSTINWNDLCYLTCRAQYNLLRLNPIF
jgi:hypothetical protein